MNDNEELIQGGQGRSAEDVCFEALCWGMMLLAGLALALLAAGCARLERLQGM
mgnify:CR=1 FL=1